MDITRSRVIAAKGARPRPHLAARLWLANRSPGVTARCSAPGTPEPMRADLIEERKIILAGVILIVRMKDRDWRIPDRTEISHAFP
jgi:hypothetical protein